MGKFLVTGGAGFIGYFLAKHLSEMGDEVWICDNFFRGKKDGDFSDLVSRKNVNFIECDLNNEGDLSRLGGSYDVVFHLAAINGTRYFYEIPHLILRNNLKSTIHILDWFVKSGSKKIVFASSSEAYAGTANRFGIPYPTPENVPLCIEDIFNPRWSYGGSKLAGELLFANYARHYGFPMAILRYTNVYGPRMGNEHVVPEFILRLLRRENPFQIYGGEETRTFFYADDAARASILVGKSPKSDNKVFNIGSHGPELKMVDLAKMLFEIMDFFPEIKINPAPEGCVKRRRADVTALSSFFPPSEGVTLQAGLRKTVNWYRTHQESFQ